MIPVPVNTRVRSTRSGQELRQRLRPGPSAGERRLAAPPSGPGALTISLRVVALLAVVLAAKWAAHLIRDTLDLTTTGWSGSCLRLRRAADLVKRGARLSREERLAMLLDRAPPRTVALAWRHRYLALAVSVNIPGNPVIGGGGGIMLMAGLSGIFAPVPTLVAVALAVSPVPLAVYIYGRVSSFSRPFQAAMNFLRRT